MRAIVEFPIAYFITTVTKDRRRLFRDIRLARRLATMLRLTCRIKGFALLGYCILPDHIHLLILRQRTLERVRWVVNEGGKQGFSPTTEGALFPPPLFISNEGGIPPKAATRAPAASIGDLMRSIKGTFSRTMQHGHVWQRRYHLRRIIDDKGLINVVNYIQYNNQKHHLAEPFGQEPYAWLNQSILKRML